MANEILKFDQNSIRVLAGVTDDADQDIMMLRVDPITKRLLVKSDGGGGGSQNLQSVTDLGATTTIESSFLGGLITNQVKADAVGGLYIKSDIGSNIAWFRENKLDILGTDPELNIGAYLGGQAAMIRLNGEALFYYKASDNKLLIGSGDASLTLPVHIYASTSTPVGYFTKTGRFGVGVDPSYNIHVSGTGLMGMFGTDPAVIGIGTPNTVGAFVGGYYTAGGSASTIYFGQNSYFSGSTWVQSNTSARSSTLLQQTGSLLFYRQNSGNASNSLGTISLQMSDRAIIYGDNINYFPLLKLSNVGVGGRSYWFYNGALAAGNLGLYDETAGAYRMILDSTGNFGYSENTPTALVDLAASTATRASLRIRNGVIPTTPNNGDIWSTADTLEMEIDNKPTILDRSLKQYALWNPPGGSTTLPGVFGYNAPTAVGTATARVIATTNFATRLKRMGYVSVATAGGLCGHYNVANNSHFTVGSGTGVGGFYYVTRFVVSDAATVSGARMAIGLRTAITAPTNVEPNTLVNTIAVAQLSTSTNLHIVYGGSAAQTAIDLGANFPANTLSADAYELTLISSPNRTDVKYKVVRLNTGDTATGTLSGTAGTVLPSSTTLLGHFVTRTNNATALAVGIDVVSHYCDSNY